MVKQMGNATLQHSKWSLFQKSKIHFCLKTICDEIIIFQREYDIIVRRKPFTFCCSLKSIFDFPRSMYENIRSFFYQVDKKASPVKRFNKLVISFLFHPTVIQHNKTETPFPNDLINIYYSTISKEKVFYLYYSTRKWQRNSTKLNFQVMVLPYNIKFGVILMLTPLLPMFPKLYVWPSSKVNVCHVLIQHENGVFLGCCNSYRM